MKYEYLNTVRRSEMSRVHKAAREMEDYCMLHPRTPAAVRRPRISKHRGTWIALLGSSIGDGIAGFGPDISSALEAFNRNYLAALRPPEV
jgi:hypothetical protein